MKSNILRIYKDKRSMVIFWLIIIIPCIDLIALKLQWETNFNPLIAFFLVGSSEGHITQILLFWFLPIYLLILCSENYIQDVKMGYQKILISAIGKRKYFWGKIKVSFLVPFFLMLISLLINLFLSYLVYAGGTESSGIFENFSYQHPLMIDIIFLLCVSFITGLAGVLGSSVSFIFPDRKYAYSLTFFIWFILIALPNDSITILMQPFTEFGFDYFIRAFLVNVLILISIPIFAYIYKVKTDEL